MWKWLLIAFVVCVLMCGGGGAFLAFTPQGKKLVQGSAFAPKPTPVRVEAVAKGDLVRVVNAPGSIEPKTKVQISAQVIARITELPFREGQQVKAGDVVVRLDSRELAAALESAQAQLRGEQARLLGNEATLAQAERDLTRKRDLMATDDETKASVEEAEERALRARASLESSRHAVEQFKALIVRAQKDLENTTIVAPFDGTITKLNAEVGELVVVGTLNNASSVIMEIADLNTMLMKARVDEANIAPVRSAQPCKVFINAYTNKSFSGKVEKVGLKRLIDRDGTGYFEVEVLVDKPKDLIFGSGLTANVDIQVQELSAVMKVPSQAVVERRLDELPASVRNSPLIDAAKAFAPVVFVYEKGRARAVAVKTGASDLTHTVVTDGLNVGDQIVTGPFKALLSIKDNDLIKQDKNAGAKSNTNTDPGEEDDDPAKPEEE